MEEFFGVKLIFKNRCKLNVLRDYNLEQPRI